MNYTPPAWRVWLFELLDYGVEYLLLWAGFGVLGALASGHIYQSALGPVHLDTLVSFGFMITLLEIMLWWLLEGIVELISAWALWLTPTRAVACGMVAGAALWLASNR
jgi:hypothetical protein